MNEVKVFTCSDFGAIRTTLINDEPYFIGKDIASILGYTNPNEAIQDHVAIEDKLNSKMLSSFEYELGQRGGWLINESGLYSLILSSKLESAKKFKHWVTSEVLPAIRKHGMWATDELLNNPDFLVEVALKLKEEKALRLAAEEKNALLMASNETYTPTQIAKELGFPVRGFCGFLHAEGYIYYQNNSWEPYSQYSDWFITKTDIVNGFTKYWIHITQKGRANLLKKYGGIKNA